MGIKGIDVSSYQSNAPDLSGKDFCFIKATQGTSYVNPRMAAQAAHARAAGVVVGFYHYVVPGDMKAQAAYFVKNAVSLAGDVLWVDWEDPGVTCAQKDQFIKEVQRLRGSDHRVGLYCNTSYWTTRDTTGFYGDALWIAVYGRTAGNPGIKAGWKFHQYTDKPVDTSVSTFASRAALKVWATKAPASKPVVSVAHINAARKKDMPAATGHTTYPAEVKVVEAALKAEGRLSAKYAADGSWGTLTDDGFNAFRRSIGLTGDDAKGSVGIYSLKELGDKHGFTVKA